MVSYEEGMEAGWVAEISWLMNTVETPAQVIDYITKFLPCTCLTEIKKVASKETDSQTGCHCCKKALPFSELKECSKCHAAYYCSKECQVRALLRLALWDCCLISFLFW